QGFDKTRQSVRIIPEPVAWHFTGDGPDICEFDPLDAGENRLKRIPAGYLFVYGIAGVDSPKRRIDKIPLAGIEAVALVDEHGAVQARSGRLIEHGLPSVAVPGPFVEDDHAMEVLTVRDLAKERFWEVIEDGRLVRVYDILGAELQAACARN